MSKNSLRVNFANIIERERKERDLSLVEFANLIGFDSEGKHLMSPSYLSRIENGKLQSPGFKNVCILIDRLSLDAKEVFKSFGYQRLVEGYEKWDSIEEIIRFADIQAPLVQDGGAIIQESLLDLKEKQILISLINSIFSIGVCKAERVLYNIENIVEEIAKYRESRKIKGEEHFNKHLIVDIEYINFPIKMSDKMVSQMNFYGFTKEDIFEIISSYHEKINKFTDGDYSILLKEQGLSINLTVDNTYLIIKSISNFME